MIGSLSGKPTVISPDTLLVDVDGVGYKVTAPRGVIDHALKQETIYLFIHTHLRDETLDLFGFLRHEELELFKTLLTIAGIGPRIALSIMNHEVEAIRRAVVTADVEFFTTIPRLGKKNAQRIIIELKPKMGTLAELDLMGEAHGETQEVIDALSSLGFSKKEALEALGRISKEAKTVEAKVAAALKFLGKSQFK